MSLGLSYGRVRSWCIRNLARPQGPEPFSPQLDGLRFIAIIGVVLYHLEGNFSSKFPGHDLGWIGRLWSRGAFGVPLFFAISGFIISRPFLRHKSVSIKRYMLRRLSRLEPPYFINLILVFMLKVWILGVAASQLWPHLVASMAYSHNIWYGEESLVNGVSWSLEVEWQFYVTAPLIFALTIRPRARWWLIWILILAGGIADGLASTYRPQVALSLLHYFGFFVGGVWAAAVIEKDALKFPPIIHDLIWISAGLAILMILMGFAHFGNLPGSDQPYLYVCLPLLCAFTILGAMHGGIARAVLGWWPIYIIGGMCYSIYLYHFFVISAMSGVINLAPDWFGYGPFGLVLYASVIVPSVILACAVPYILIERPFMVWRPGRNSLRSAFRWPG